MAKTIYTGSNERLEILSYIESTGTQYIDIGIVPTQTTRIVAKIEFTSSTQATYAGMFGAQVDDDNTYGYTFSNVPGSQIKFKGSQNYMNGLTFATNAVYEVDCSLNTFIINNIRYTNTDTWTQEMDETIFLFGRNSAGKLIDSTLTTGKVYYFQVYENDNLICDLIPVKTENGNICLHDKITHKKFYNKGTGNFIAGSITSENIIIKNESREVKAMYTSALSSRVIVKNLCPTINGATGFTVQGGSGNTIESSTTHVKYSANSLKITGSASNSESCAQSSEAILLNSKHKYYARVEVYQENAGGGTDFYWPIAEPNVYSHSTIGEANIWNLHSAVVDRSSFEDGLYNFRLDLNNNKTAQTAWFDGWMIIDLTQAFGYGNEPTKEWCDTNIPYFENIYNINRDTPVYVAKKVIKGYIGVNGVSKVFFSSRTKIEKIGEIEPLSIGRYALSGGATKDYVIFGGGRTASNTNQTTLEAYNSQGVKVLNSTMNSSFGPYSRDISFKDGVLFAGGPAYTAAPSTNILNIDNSLTSSVLSATLSIGRIDMTRGATKDYALFICGNMTANQGTVYNNIDVLDKSYTRSTLSPIMTKRYSMPGGAFNNAIIFGGGLTHTKTGTNNNSTTPTRLTEAFVINNSLTQTKIADRTVRNGAFANLNNKYALFMGGGSTNSADGGKFLSSVDVYDTSFTKINANIFLSEAKSSGSSRNPIVNFAISFGGFIGTDTGTTIVEGFNDSLTREFFENTLYARRNQYVISTIADKAIFLGGGEVAGTPTASVEMYKIIY